MQKAQESIPVWTWAEPEYWDSIGVKACGNNQFSGSLDYIYIIMYNRAISKSKPHEYIYIYMNITTNKKQMYNNNDNQEVLV